MTQVNVSALGGLRFGKEDTTQDDRATQTVSFWHIFA